MIMQKYLMYFALIIICCCFCYVQQVEALLRRCYQCRSRGELGSCKDPFNYNATDAEREPGLATMPCASGWCGKVIEGGGAYSVDDYDQAVQRMCLQRGPDDSQDRCANTVYNYKSVFMCFCQGDLCNGSAHVRAFSVWQPLSLASAALAFALRIFTL